MRSLGFPWPALSLSGIFIVGVLVRRSSVSTVWHPLFRVSRIDESVIVILGECLALFLGAYTFCHIIVATKFKPPKISSQSRAEVCNFVVVDGDEDHAGLAEEVPRQVSDRG